jgi:hypothetical protein
MSNSTQKGMGLNPMMLATPAKLLTRLTSLPGKNFSGDFKEMVSRLERPYYRLSEQDYEAVKAASGSSDVLLFDGKTQVTFGTADNGWALMPLERPL